MNYFRLLFTIVVAYLSTSSFTAFGQLTVTPGQPAAVLAAKLAGPGITIISPTLTCATQANGTFINVATPLTLDSGILLTTGRAIQTAGLESFLANTNNGTPGDAALATLAGAATFDACTLEFDFIPNGDTVSFNYQFGSEEYINSTCGPYNDAFAFFISGPGITGTQNMALVPGTSIPVTVNSINSGIPGSGYTLANCTAMGAGSPFTSFFYNNTGGTQLTYRGYTTRLRAFHAVTPCSTFHMKISVVDAGNRLYDSGVFIDAGSLKTNSYFFNTADSIGGTLAGVPRTLVKGCMPDTIRVMGSRAIGTSKTMRFTFGGSAVRGVDYTMPDSAVIVAGDTAVGVILTPLPTLATGAKTVSIYLLSPFSCGIVDSIVINLLDSVSATILTPDTTICSGTAFQLRVNASSPFLGFSWLPGTGLSSSVVMQPIASPLTTTTYSMSATMPPSVGCPAIVRSVTVNVINTSISMLTPDTSICKGGRVNIRLNGGSTLDYRWTPPTGLSDTAIQNPVATPTVTTVYSVTATGPGGVCPRTVGLRVTVAEINMDIITMDTTICEGASFRLRATGNSGPTFTWTPATGLTSTSILQPIASPVVTTNYVLTASWPGSGCPDVTDAVNVTVINTAVTLLTPDTLICYRDNVGIRVNGDPLLVYSWSPAYALSDPAIANPIATPLTTTEYTLTSSSVDKLCSSTVKLKITVANPVARLLIADTTICKGSTRQLLVAGDTSLDYLWSPATGLSATDVMQPFASPTEPTVYTMVATVPGTPCSVTGQVAIDVVTTKLANVTLGHTITYGSSIQLHADSFLYYMWMPNDGSLDNNNINNPIATPQTATVYTVTATDLNGCVSSATVNINVVFEDVLFIPDAFTPNGDGLNDLFRVGNLRYSRLVNFRIFNRWGQPVYESVNGEDNGWDGTYQGAAQDLGTYNYLVIVARPDGVQKSYKGNVTLIR